MLNYPQFYVELGTKAAEARNQHDEARAKFHADHFRRARGLEQEEDRILADTLYREAYGASRVTPRVEYFR
mgnify:CR=1 FL=1